MSKNLSSMTYRILSGLNSPLSSTISILDRTSIYLFVIFQCFQRFTIEDPLGRIMSFSIHYSNTAFLRSLQVVYFFPSKYAVVILATSCFKALICCVLNITILIKGLVHLLQKFCNNLIHNHKHTCTSRNAMCIQEL